MIFTKFTNNKIKYYYSNLFICLFNFLEPSSILATIKKKKDIELMNESSDADRVYNPFQKKSAKQAKADISIDTFSPLDEVIHFFIYKKRIIIFI